MTLAVFFFSLNEFELGLLWQLKVLPLKCWPYAFIVGICARQAQHDTRFFLIPKVTELRSFAENGKDCPACHPENKKILDMFSAQKNNRDLHDTLHHKLNTSEDRFSFTAEYCGRRVFRNPAQAVNELSKQVREMKQEQTGPGA